MEILTDMDDEVLRFFGDPPELAWRFDVPVGPTAWECASRLFGHEAFRSLRLEGPCLPEGFPILYLIRRSLRSNLEIISDLHRQGTRLPERFICAAWSGEGFLGRHDRTWRCEPGNLHAVVGLRPGMPLDHAGCAFTILGSVACVDAVEMSAPDGPGIGIKWVNDILVEGRKVAGFLTRQTYKDPLITDAFLGIGVNVLTDPGIAPNPFVMGTQCLKGVYPGVSWTPGGFLLNLLGKVHFWLDCLEVQGVSPLMRFYREKSLVLGEMVRIYQDGFGFDGDSLAGRRLIAAGRVEEILDDLSLRIQGVEAPIQNGRLAFESDCPKGDP